MSDAPGVEAPIAVALAHLGFRSAEVGFTPSLDLG